MFVRIEISTQNKDGRPEMVDQVRKLSRLSRWHQC